MLLRGQKSPRPEAFAHLCLCPKLHCKPWLGDDTKVISKIADLKFISKSALHVSYFSLVGNIAQIKNGTKLASILQHQLSKPPTVPKAMPIPADIGNDICGWMGK